MRVHCVPSLGVYVMLVRLGEAGFLCVCVCVC